MTIACLVNWPGDFGLDIRVRVRKTKTNDVHNTLERKSLFRLWRNWYVDIPWIGRG